MRFKIADGSEIRGNSTGFKIDGKPVTNGSLFIRLGDPDPVTGLYRTRAVIPLEENKKGDKIHLAFLHGDGPAGRTCWRRPEEIYARKLQAQGVDK